MDYKQDNQGNGQSADKDRVARQAYGQGGPPRSRSPRYYHPEAQADEAEVLPTPKDRLDSELMSRLIAS